LNRLANGASIFSLTILLTIQTGFLLLFLLYCFWASFNPFKVIEPYNLRFEPNEFRFEDYTGPQCVEKEAIAKIFPIGTHKNFVDRILVRQAGAHAQKVENRVETLYKYTYQPRTLGSIFFTPSEWQIEISYDHNDQVTDIKMSEPGGSNKSVYEFFKDCRFGTYYGRNWK